MGPTMAAAIAWLLSTMDGMPIKLTDYHLIGYDITRVPGPPGQKTMFNFRAMLQQDAGAQKVGLPAPAACRCLTGGLHRIEGYTMRQETPGDPFEHERRYAKSCAASGRLLCVGCGLDSSMASRSPRCHPTSARSSTVLGLRPKGSISTSLAISTAIGAGSATIPSRRT